jgi:F-type H+-transporting ATPase subunit b
VFLFAEMNAYEAARSLFENNLINWLVLLAGLIYLWKKYVPAMFAAREESITQALRDAAQAKLQSEKMLAEQKVRISNAEREASKILSDAKVFANELKVELETQTEKEVSQLKTRIEQQITYERELAVTQMREAAAKASISLTEKILPSLLDEAVKSRLLTEFMEQLDKEVGQGTTFAAERLESINR